MNPILFMFDFNLEYYTTNLLFLKYKEQLDKLYFDLDGKGQIGVTHMVVTPGKKHDINTKLEVPILVPYHNGIFKSQIRADPDRTLTITLEKPTQEVEDLLQVIFFDMVNQTGTLLKVVDGRLRTC